ncbi:hypothetical protein [Agromyces larvae]|uniref:YtxH domain-containing protein n=1 Tax=Agromyces larvae TaxID=2929802 RepID=A0ABY4BWK1_9MICO|nr:hypothetical protein [Agromyces larvae]UOE43567.1 hypothetical protein MTO99_15520 [Agromyces larvae]
MKGKILFVVGLGVGYVLGTRAGRERYEQIKRAAEGVWNQPAVQQGVGTVKDFALSKVGDLSDTVLDNVKQFIGSATKPSGGGSSEFRRAAEKAATGVSDAAKRAADGVSDAVEDAADAVEDAAERADKAKSSSRSTASKSTTSTGGAKRAGRAKPAASDR